MNKCKRPKSSPCVQPQEKNLLECQTAELIFHVSELLGNVAVMFWKLAFGVNRQSGLETASGIFQILRTIPDRNTGVNNPQVALGHSPIDWKVLLGMNSQSRFVGGDGLFVCDEMVCEACMEIVLME